MISEDDVFTKYPHAGETEFWCISFHRKLSTLLVLRIKSGVIYTAPPTTCFGSQLQPAIRFIPALLTDTWVGADSQPCVHRLKLYPCFTEFWVPSSISFQTNGSNCLKPPMRKHSRWLSEEPYFHIKITDRVICSLPSKSSSPSSVSLTISQVLSLPDLSDGWWL